MELSNACYDIGSNNPSLQVFVNQYNEIYDSIHDMFSSRSAANSVAHIESGACPKCPGKEEARKKMFNFIANHKVLTGYAPQLCEYISAP